MDDDITVPLGRVTFGPEMALCLFSNIILSSGFRKCDLAPESAFNFTLPWEEIIVHARLS